MPKLDLGFISPKDFDQLVDLFALFQYAPASKLEEVKPKKEEFDLFCRQLFNGRGTAESDGLSFEEFYGNLTYEVRCRHFTSKRLS